MKARVSIINLSYSRSPQIAVNAVQRFHRFWSLRSIRVVRSTGRASCARNCAAAIFLPIVVVVNRAKNTHFPDRIIDPPNGRMHLARIKGPSELSESFLAAFETGPTSLRPFSWKRILIPGLPFKRGDPRQVEPAQMQSHRWWSRWPAHVFPLRAPRGTDARGANHAHTLTIG